MITKKRLSDITRQETTDRTSKLLAGLVPAPVTPEPAAEEHVNPTPPPVEKTPVADSDLVAEKPVQAPPAPVPTKSKRSAKGLNVSDILAMPDPGDIRCSRPIMLTDAHHEMLRNLSFQHRKPMTVILYNLLEMVNQNSQQEQTT